MNALLCALLPSSSAPAASGPKTEMPASRSSSATPATSGASGPMTTRSTPCSRTNESTDEPLIISTSLTLVATAAVPPLPGATNSSSHRGDLESAHAIACSRPPLPSTKMFTTNPFSQVRQIQARKAREPNRKARRSSKKSASAALASADGVKDFNAYFKVRKKSLERQLHRQSRAQRRLVARAVKPAQPKTYQPRMMVWSRSGPTATIEIFTPVISSRCSTYF